MIILILVLVISNNEQQRMLNMTSSSSVNLDTLVKHDDEEDWLTIDEKDTKLNYSDTFENDEFTPIKLSFQLTEKQIATALVMLKARHKLSNICLKHICYLLRLLKVSNVPKSYSRIMRIFHRETQTSDKSTIINICNECNETCKTAVHCDNVECSQHEYLKKTPLKFVYMSILPQIRNILARTQYLNFERQNQSTYTIDVMKDITDRAAYNRILLEQLQTKFISLLMNIDGIQIAKSSNASLWVISFVVNELKRDERFKMKNIIIAGVSSSKTKPSRDQMYTILTPIVKELKELENGRYFDLKVFNGDLEPLRVFLLAVCLDKPAQAITQNLNGCGCGYVCQCCSSLRFILFQIMNKNMTDTSSPTIVKITNDDSHINEKAPFLNEPVASNNLSNLSDSFTLDKTGKNKLPFPDFVEKVFYRIRQTTTPRYQCLLLITWPYFEYIIMFLILLNCIILGMYEPCAQYNKVESWNKCSTISCTVLHITSGFIFVLFIIEMCIKMIAMGVLGEGTYLANSWNRFDCFIVLAGSVEFLITTNSWSLSVIRTVRVLRPLRIINRIPSMRIIVQLLLDTLPILGNILLLWISIFFIFGFIGVQLWKGLLRKRCFLQFNETSFVNYELFNYFSIPPFYTPSDDKSFICSDPLSSGMTKCSEIPPFRRDKMTCKLNFDSWDLSLNQTMNGCINWNHYYRSCVTSDQNPFSGTISFDDIRRAWTAILQIITLENWSIIMYYVQDAHSFWNWIYFVCLIIVGSYVMINLCLFAISAQLNVTKKREIEKMLAEQKQFIPSTNAVRNDQAISCWEKIINYFQQLSKNEYQRLSIFWKNSQYKHDKINQRYDEKIITTADPLINQNHRPNCRYYQLQSLLSTSPNNNLSFIEKNRENKTNLEIEQQIEQNNICDCYHQDEIVHRDDKEEENSKCDQRSNSCCCSSLKIIQTLISRLVANKYFDGIIFLAIIINTFLIAIEYHGQPQFLTNLLQFNNYFFTILFTIEILLKIIAHGCLAYIKNLFNIFDGGIVLISLIQLIISGNSGLSVLRAFRLLCLLKFLRCMPTLRRHLIIESCFSRCCGQRIFGWFKERENYSLYLFSPSNKLRKVFQRLILEKLFDYLILFFIVLNCITLAMERPSISSTNFERQLINYTNYICTIIFIIEMMIKIIASGLIVGSNTYLRSGWNVVDGFLVIIAIIDIGIMHRYKITSSPQSDTTSDIADIVTVFRLLRALIPLRVINRAPGVKFVVPMLLSSLKAIANVCIIFSIFFIIFGILGVQLFKGKFYYCEGPLAHNVPTRKQCEMMSDHQWRNQEYNFDNLGQALLTLLALTSKDDSIPIMYMGVNTVEVDMQPIKYYSKKKLIYFISFLLVFEFYGISTFVGIVVENFHNYHIQQKRNEETRKQRKPIEHQKHPVSELPYYTHFSPWRKRLYDICVSKYFDLIITVITGIYVVTISCEFYLMPVTLDIFLKYCNYVFTIIFLLEFILKIVALGPLHYFKDKWNLLDSFLLLALIADIILEKIISGNILPISATLIRMIRLVRIARVLKLLKMIKGIRSLLNRVSEALPHVGNLGLLLFLLFFIFAILAVELFGKLECSQEQPCSGLSKHANFKNFGIALLTLFRIATGDNWNDIMKDTLRQDDLSITEENKWTAMISPIYFVTFVTMTPLVLTNMVVVVLLKNLENSNKMTNDDAKISGKIELQLQVDLHDRNNFEQ
ncbi:unnamed protein product [Rotaria sordida]|uniref:Ion transport domain-containing protein n=1 Tax=Rotaria sordida TaxID=392033 RepID=A0A814ZPH4_9BILA|nr:unnamed protein product [Rotaria sordida]CAF1526007.1 unnamed protein product [Rotaria sordida]